jgi:hypothetical protein
MKNTLISVVLLLSLLSGCASYQPIPLKADVKAQVRSVAIVEAPEPEKQYVLGAASVPGGFALYAFGALGGLVLGGIEAARMETQASNLTTAMKPFAPQVNAVMREAVAQQLKARGIEVSFIAPPKMKSDDRTPDYASLNLQSRFILEPVVTMVGYRLNGGSLQPMLAARVRLLDSSGQTVHYAEVYGYGSMLNNKFNHVESDSKYSYGELDQLYANGKSAAEALTVGATGIGERIGRALQ